MKAEGEDRMVGGEKKDTGIGGRERKTSLCRGEEEAGGGVEKEIWKDRRKPHKQEESRVLAGVKTPT